MTSADLSRVLHRALHQQDAAIGGLASGRRYVDAMGNPLPPIKKLDDLPNIKVSKPWV